MISFPIAIVLYKPTDSTINRILELLEKNIVFYVFDNSNYVNDVLSGMNNNNLNYYSFNKNFGLSYSIDYLCKVAISNHNNYLLFFDQDTIFKLETLEFINNFITVKNIEQNLLFDTVLSINFRDSSSEQKQLNIINIFTLNSKLLYNVYFSINSGSLYFLDKYNKFNWFEDKYFVDGVDYSLSLNAIINNYKNLVIIDVPGLNHTEEQGDSIIKIFGKEFSGRIYPLKRNIDFIKSHFKLMIKSLKTNQIKPVLFIIKALISYIFIQTVFRLINVIKY
jgi:hypothetical protein